MSDLSAQRTTLEQGLVQLGLSLPQAQIDLLMAYLALLAKWNKAYNLTAVKDVDDMVVLHLLDSLSVLPHLQGQRLMDVGTGAGLPGIVLAITCPGRQFTLLDTNGKKTRFLVQVKAALGLDNVTVVKQRVETFRPDPLCDAVLSRAFASLPDMINGCRQLIGEGGRFLAMKGVVPEEELADLPPDIRLEQVIPLTVPYLQGERHLIVLQKWNSD